MTVSWKNKLVGAVATGAIVAGLFPMAALGAGASVLDSTATNADPAGPGYKLVVTGLEQNDGVTYYQIIEQDLDDTTTTPTTVGSQQWKLTAAVDKGGDGIVDGTEGTDFGHKTPGPDGELGTSDDVSVNGLWVDEMVIPESTATVTEGVVTSDTRQLTPDMVNAIAAAIVNNEANSSGTTTASTADGNGHYKVEVTQPENKQGMYMFAAVPADPNANYVYKPIFVSTDYYNTISKPEDNTHQLDLLEGNQRDQYGNPIGVDYPPTSGSTANAGVFKRSPLTIDKKSGTYNADGTPIDKQTDVAVGDTVDFTITVPMTTYSKNYVAPQFYITDALTKGLELDLSGDNPITVEVKSGNTVIPTSKDKDYKIYTKTMSGANKTEGYDKFKGKEDEDAAIDGFVVQFLSDDPTTPNVKKDGFLYSPAIAPVCTITYKAKVLTTDGAIFAQQVNQMDNTAKLEFSHDPNFVPAGYLVPSDPNDPDSPKVPSDDFEPDKPDHVDEKGDPEDTGELEDKTHHYTFDIDADILGNPQTPGTPGPNGEPSDESNHDKTSEIRKTWVDANGKVIQEKEASKVVKGGEEQDGKTGEYGWLEGAEFTLTKTQEHVTTYTGADGQTGTEEFKPLATPEQVKFDANHIRVTTGGSNPISDPKGYIAMKGLDAGVYVLKEIKAPLGYAFNPNIQYEITITPTYVFEQAATAAHPDLATLDGKGSGDDLILKSYEVKIVTQKLDDQMNIVGNEKVETICTYNIKADSDGNPLSTLNDNGSQNPEVTIDTTVQSFGANETAMIVNKKLGMLPATGGSGIIFYLGVGGAVALVASYLLKNTKEEDPLA